MEMWIKLRNPYQPENSVLVYRCAASLTLPRNRSLRRCPHRTAARWRLPRVWKAATLKSRAKASAGLVIKVSAGWASLSSHGLWGGDAPAALLESLESETLPTRRCGSTHRAVAHATSVPLQPATSQCCGGDGSAGTVVIGRPVHRRSATV